MGYVWKCTRDMYGPLLDDLRCMYVCTNDIENEYKYEIAGFGHKKGNYNNVIFSKSHIWWKRNYRWSKPQTKGVYTLGNSHFNLSIHYNSIEKD